SDRAGPRTAGTGAGTAARLAVRRVHPPAAPRVPTHDTGAAVQDAAAAVRSPRCIRYPRDRSPAPRRPGGRHSGPGMKGAGGATRSTRVASPRFDLAGGDVRAN